jgi:bacteriocin biosynthesis cyclodehydratase domain-containing protein
MKCLFPLPDTVRRSIESHGVLLTNEAPFLLVVTDDYLRGEIVTIAREETRPWLLARPVGRQLLLGPLFRNSESPCWFCLAYRLRTRRWMQASLSGCGESDCPPQPAWAHLPGTMAVAAGWMATAASLFLTTGRFPQAEGAVLQLDLVNFTLARSVVPPRGNCERCGGVAGGASPPANLLDWANSVTGIVESLYVTGQPQGGYYHAAANFYQPLPLPGARSLVKPGAAFGHGATQAAAELSCMAEVLERASAVYRGDEPRIQARLEQIEGISPNHLLLISDTQYQNRAAWNANNRSFHYVPERFDPDLSIEWTQATSLTGSPSRYFPTASCYLWYPHDPAHAFTVADSNGLAAGATVQDALLHGILELIERDALALWWYNRILRPGVDLAMLEDPRMRATIDALRGQGRTPILLDLTSDIGVPVYVAIAPREDGSQPFFGCAAHPDAAIAAEKAIREMEQIRFWSVQSGSTPEFADWLREATTAGEPYLLPRGSVPLRPALAPSGRELLECCLERLTLCGMNAYALELTRPEFNLPVWRIFVPGLRHCWKRTASGRLYDVPVALGWLPAPLSEDQLNPRGCPL